MGTPVCTCCACPNGLSVKVSKRSKGRRSPNRQDDEFTSKVAKTVEEACVLIDAGYEYVTEFREEGIKIFKKRK